MIQGELRSLGVGTRRARLERSELAFARREITSLYLRPCAARLDGRRHRPAVGATRGAVSFGDSVAEWSSTSSAARRIS
jgi:hypothetical protein